tara:strand:- start:6301 stop:7143 length:843 start_codon:yes stop_codon:yes gene_type:complete
MKIITLGTGESCDFHSNKLNLLNPDIKKFAFHRTFMLLKERNIDVDYWTWTDPDAAESGLEWMVKNPQAKHPIIILPYWAQSLVDFERLYYVPGNLQGPRILKHFELLNTEAVKKNIVFINNAINNVFEVKQIKNGRFDREQVVFHTPTYKYPYLIMKKGDYSFKVPVVLQKNKPLKDHHLPYNYGPENVFTRHLLPICHYLRATEVYNLGCDNSGLGFNRQVPQWGGDSIDNINSTLSYFKLWKKWEPLHHMKIYRCMEDRFTNIGDIMPYKSLEELYA